MLETKFTQIFSGLSVIKRFTDSFYGVIVFCKYEIRI